VFKFTILLVLIDEAMQYSASRERVLDVLADGKPLSTLEVSKKTGLTRS
jgi:hypothetical protein